MAKRSYETHREVARHLLTVWLFVVCLSPSVLAQQTNTPTVLNDDGAWCWFQDERAIIAGSTLLIGSVANGASDPARTGDVDVVAYDLEAGRLRRYELHDQLESDDHAAPAFWLLPDGRVLAVYSKHGPEHCFYSRVTSRPNDFTGWEPIATFALSDNSRVTYSNLHFVAAEGDGRGRLYNFFRGLDASFKPSFAWSDDYGATWSRGNVLIDVPLEFPHRPYVKYASNGRDAVHLLYTDGHPRDYDNSVYHVFYRDGHLHRTEGTRIGPLSLGLKSPDQGTCVFRGNRDNVAWVSDLHLSPDGRPYAVFSVQKNSAGLSSGHRAAGNDHRYYYAWWNGTQWRDAEIAHAGSRLYPGEDDYTGNICLNPNRLHTVYLSANVDPATGKPLRSGADGQRHFEIYRGTTPDQGATWNWNAITHDSSVDNLRPIVPTWNGSRTALLWFRGTYVTYRNYRTEVVGLILQNPQ